MLQNAIDLRENKFLNCKVYIYLKKHYIVAS